MMSRARLRYRFDNLMSRGVGAQVLLLAAVTLALVVVAALATIGLEVTPKDSNNHDDSFVMLVWLTLMHSLDAGMLGGDGFGSWPFLLVMLAVTIGGLFVVSALIGVLNQGFGERLDGLRRGRSAVVERGHTVILGWNAKVFPLLSELAEANRNQRRACVVILADRDKVEMDEELATAMGRTGMRVVTRRGDVLSIDDLGLVALEHAKAVIVLAPERHADGSVVADSEADAVVLKTLLALRKATDGRAVQVVAELLDERTGPVARTVLGDRAALVLTGPLVSRLLVQTSRQSGLADVYTELLDFAGCEIYLTELPGLTGVTFREAVFRFGTSSLIGVRTAAGDLLLPPPLDRRFEPGDQAVTISEDDDRVVLDGVPAVDPATIVPAPVAAAPRPENLLILGTSPRLPLVLRELDGFMAPDSRSVVIGAGDPEETLASVGDTLVNTKLSVHRADITDRRVLDSLDAAGYDSIMLLSQTTDRSQDMADACTIITLLHLRDLTQAGRVPITSEILDVRNRDLAATGERDDFIVSNRLVSLVMSQIAENPRLADVLDVLLSKEGHELYVRPAAGYVRPGRVTFASVCEAALRRNEIAVGYRPGDLTAGRAVINPAKSTELSFGAGDQVIVLAES